MQIVQRLICGKPVDVNDIIQVKTLRRLWKDGVPASVKKKPNHRPAKSDEWTAGWEWIEITGRVETLDGNYMRVEMWSTRNNRLCGRFTSINLDKIGECHIL